MDNQWTPDSGTGSNATGGLVRIQLDLFLKPPPMRLVDPDMVFGESVGEAFVAAGGEGKGFGSQTGESYSSYLNDCILR